MKNATTNAATFRCARYGNGDRNGGTARFKSSSSSCNDQQQANAVNLLAKSLLLITLLPSLLTQRSEAKSMLKVKNK